MQFSVDPPWLVTAVAVLLVLLLFAVGWWQQRRGRAEGIASRDAELRAQQSLIEAAAGREQAAQERLLQLEQQREAMRERLDESSDRRAPA